METEKPVFWEMTATTLLRRPSLETELSKVLMTSSEWPRNRIIGLKSMEKLSRSGVERKLELIATDSTYSDDAAIKAKSLILRPAFETETDRAGGRWREATISFSVIT